ncbi:MAG: hypothetical protein K9M75_09170 [Phycisphaerae bacterium]|nr:hypothetical protein [Phycisphaerae bacterium]
MTLRNIRCLFLTLVLLAVFNSSLIAIEKDNRGRWETPTKSGPDKDVPGYLINLGPTGARAILESKSFIVKYIFKVQLPKSWLIYQAAKACFTFNAKYFES